VATEKVVVATNFIVRLSAAAGWVLDVWLVSVEYARLGYALVCLSLKSNMGITKA
jgi:hypothetical protein